MLKESTAGLIIYQATPPPPPQKKKREKKKKRRKKKKELKTQGLLIYQVKDTSETKVPDLKKELSGKTLQLTRNFPQSILSMEMVGGGGAGGRGWGRDACIMEKFPKDLNQRGGGGGG